MQPVPFWPYLSSYCYRGLRLVSVQAVHNLVDAVGDASALSFFVPGLTMGKSASRVSNPLDRAWEHVPTPSCFRLRSNGLTRPGSLQASVGSSCRAPMPKEPGPPSPEPGRPLGAPRLGRASRPWSRSSRSSWGTRASRQVAVRRGAADPRQRVVLMKHATGRRRCCRP